MALWLGALVALAGSLGSDPSTHLVSPGLCGQTYKPARYTYIYNKANPFSKEILKRIINGIKSKSLFFTFSVSNFQMNSNGIFSKLI